MLKLFFYLFDAKTKTKTKIEPVQNILDWFKIFVPVQKMLYWFKDFVLVQKFVPKAKIELQQLHLRTTITNFLWHLNGRDVNISTLVLTTVFE